LIYSEDLNSFNNNNGVPARREYINYLMSIDYMILVPVASGNC